MGWAYLLRTPQHQKGRGPSIHFTAVKVEQWGSFLSVYTRDACIENSSAVLEDGTD